MNYPADLLWLPATVHRTPSFLVITLRIMSSALKCSYRALEKALNEPSVASQFKFGLHQLLFWRILEAEAELPTNRLHALVFGKDGTSEALEFFVAAKLYQP